MKRRKQLRLFAGFTVAILLVLGVGGATYLTLKKQVEEQGVVRHTYKVINQVNYINQLMIDMETGRRGFRCTNDRSFLDLYYRSQPRLMPAVDVLSNFVADNAEQSTRVKRLEIDTRRVDSFWKSINTSTIYADQEGKKIVTRAEKQLMDLMRVDIANITDEENELLAHREKESSTSLRHTITTLVLGDLLILIIVAALIRLIMSEFRVRRKAEKRLAEKLDELKKLNEETTSKNWQLTGVREINSSLMGAKSLHSLLENCIKKIVEYTHVPAAAWYYYDPEQNNLRLATTIGLSGNLARTVALNEGIAGQAAMRQEQTIVSNIPRNYWQITAATGSSQPDTIICVPLWAKDDLEGVLEIAVWANTSERIAALLDEVADNIAIALQAAGAKEKMQVLLAKVQEQKEELESQQEELRQTNEELTHQADILRASEEELKTQEEELRQTNTELELKTTAVEAASKELQLKAEELQQSSIYKSQFLANMSHELRTPLNSVLILANILKQNKPANLNEKQIEYAKTIHKSGTDLLTLINDILDLTKIEVGKVDIFIDRVRLKEIANDMEQLFGALAADKNVRFLIELAPGLTDHVNTDKQRLSQIMRNLLSNAFKFTPEKGIITLRFDQDDEQLSISVKDSGIGIAADKQKLIFEAFQQADGSTSRKYGGTGLGLAISRELANKLHGDIVVHSAPGQGSTFTLSLPLDGAHISKENDPAPEQITYSLAELKEQNVIADDRVRVQDGDQYLLIIEDDLVFASLLNNYAHRRGFKTMVALKGDEGLHYAKSHKPLAIMLDLGLPVIDGRNIIKMLKADPALKDIPVHVITAEDRADMPNANIESYTRKPLHPEDLEQAFQHIESYLKDHYRNILLLDPNDNKLADIFDTLTRQKSSGIIYDVAQNSEEAKALLGHKSPDCIIADISSDISRGMETLKELKNAAKAGTYFITCLDSDISQADERLLRTYSDSIIRKSTLAGNRLMDEVELFLHKIRNESKPAVPRQFTTIKDDALSGRHVLLADDDMRNVFALTAILEEQGMKVITAEDEKVAIELMTNHHDIYIVLIDVMMPDVDGYEAIKRIRKMPRYTKLPIIALTAKATPADREKCIAAGASDYITKPVDTNKLLSLMRVWLS